jgi:hypothetical protein
MNECSHACHVPLDHQEQMRSLLQAVQQDGAPGGAHEGLVPLGARAQVRHLREALPLLRVAQRASHRYAEIKLLPRRKDGSLHTAQQARFQF